MNYFLAIGPWQILLILVFFLGLIPTIIALIDIVRNEFSGYNKIVWVLIVLIGSLPGAILYFVMGRKQKITLTGTATQA